MSLSIRQHVSTGVAGGGSFNVGLSSPQVGDTLVAFIFSASSNTDCKVTSVTDSFGNVWTQVPSARQTYTDGTGTDNIDVWTATNINVKSGTLWVTATLNAVPSRAASMTVYDLSGGGLIGVGAGTSSGTAAVTVWNGLPSAVVPVGNEAFALAGTIIFGNGTFSASGSFTQDEQVNMGGSNVYALTGSLYIPNGGGGVTPSVTPSSAELCAVTALTIGRILAGGSWGVQGYGRSKPQARPFKPFYNPK